ncbi:MAG: hypothetical protein R3B39_02815 [Candidatus Paceibacterota bacterium]
MDKYESKYFRRSTAEKINDLRKVDKDIAQIVLEEERKSDKYAEAKDIHRSSVEEKKKEQETEKKVLELEQAEPHTLDASFALDLISKKKSRVVFENLQKFKDESKKEILLKLLDDGGSSRIIDLLLADETIEQEYIIQKLISNRQIGVLAENIYKFKDVDHKDLVTRIMDSGQHFSVSEAIGEGELKYFNLEMAKKFIEGKDYNYAFLKNIEYFEGDHNDLAKLVIEKSPYWLAEYLDNFSGLDKEIALKLIQEGFGENVARNYKSFNFSYDTEILKAIVLSKPFFFKQGPGNWINEEGGRKKSSMLNSVTENLSNFKNINYEDLAESMFFAGYGHYLFGNIEKFPGVDVKNLLSKAASNNFSRIGLGAILHLNDLHGFDSQIAKHYISRDGRNHRWGNLLEKFKNLDSDVALALGSIGYSSLVIKNIDRFKDLNQAVLVKLIKDGEDPKEIAKHLDKFTGLFEETIRSFDKYKDASQ